MPELSRLPRWSRTLRLVLPWAAWAGVVAACSSSENEPFRVPYRPARVRTFSARDAGSGGGASTGGAPAVGCNPIFCVGMGPGAGCCLPDGTCGVDFGLGCTVAPRDAGTPPPTPPASCKNDGSCGAGQVCCAPTQAGQIQSFSCQTSCAATDVPVHCSSPGDCPAGKICCGAYAGGAYTSLDCTDKCTGGGNGSYVVCSANEDCGDAGGTCQASLLLGGTYKVCR